MKKFFFKNKGLKRNGSSYRWHLIENEPMGQKKKLFFKRKMPAISTLLTGCLYQTRYTRRTALFLTDLLYTNIYIYCPE